MKQNATRPSRDRVPHFPYDYGDYISETDDEKRLSSRVVKKIQKLEPLQVTASISGMVLLIYLIRLKTLKNGIPIETETVPSQQKCPDIVFLTGAYGIIIRAIFLWLNIYQDDITPLLGIFDIVKRF